MGGLEDLEYLVRLRYLLVFSNQLISFYLHHTHTVDFEVGRIADALHRTGLANDTLVLITSDNGPWDVSCALQFGGRENVRLKKNRLQRSAFTPLTLRTPSSIQHLTNENR